MLLQFCVSLLMNLIYGLQVHLFNKHYHSHFKLRSKSNYIFFLLACRLWQIWLLQLPLPSSSLFQPRSCLPCLSLPCSQLLSLWQPSCQHLSLWQPSSQHLSLSQPSNQCLSLAHTSSQCLYRLLSSSIPCSLTTSCWPGWTDLSSSRNSRCSWGQPN